MTCGHASASTQICTQRPQAAAGRSATTIATLATPRHPRTPSSAGAAIAWTSEYPANPPRMMASAPPWPAPSISPWGQVRAPGTIKR